VVEKRHRESEECSRTSLHESVWEYQMRYGLWLNESRAVNPAEITAAEPAATDALRPS